MAATAVRYLRSVGAPTTAAAPATAPAGPRARPALRAVRDDERAPLDPAEFRSVLGHFASGVTVITSPGSPDRPVSPASPSPRSPSTRRW